MKESIGYTVSLNIMIVFITIIVGFLCAALIYFKSNKASNIITTSLEKYEGYNDLSINEFVMNLNSIGYGSRDITCDSQVVDEGAKNGLCNRVSDEKEPGWCIYECTLLSDEDYYFYKVRTNMMLTIPILNDLLDIPIYSNTNTMYKFRENETPSADVPCEGGDCVGWTRVIYGSSSSLTQDNHDWYYYENGIPVIGWKDLRWIGHDEKYFFDDSGKMVRGWAYIEGSLYYFNEFDKRYQQYDDGTSDMSSGEMQRGWEKITDGCWYNFNASNGVLVDINGYSDNSGTQVNEGCELPNNIPSYDRNGKCSLNCPNKNNSAGTQEKYWDDATLK